MLEDKIFIEKLLKDYIKIIIEEYGEYISEYNKNIILGCDSLVVWNHDTTISFSVYDFKLLLPLCAYDVFKVIKKHKNYGSKKVSYDYSKYLETNSTYEDYINHVIDNGLSVREYFLESLLHEAMHICGSGGGRPLEEGINELKARELAQKRGIKISAMGYPKETEVAKKLQTIIGKEIFDELTFLPFDERYNFLKQKCGIEKAKLYFNISNLMFEQMKKIRFIFKTSDPYEKAKYYDDLEYCNVEGLIK